MALPSNVSFGTVTGTFIQAVADSPTDSDRDPDALPASDLAVTFEADLSPSVVRDLTSTPPVTIFVRPVTATVGSDGTLLGPDGQPGVRLVASTDPDLSPSNWTWRVNIRSATLPTFSFSFALEPGSSVDLATVLNVPAGPGITPDAIQAALVVERAANTNLFAFKPVALTQAAYDALTVKSPTTLYLITD